MEDEKKQEQGEDVEEDLSSADELDGKSQPPKSKKVDHLPYYLRNSVKYIFKSLDSEGNLAVAKSKLQVVCANLCRVWNISFSSEYLNDHTESSTLGFEDFIRFIETDLLTKPSTNKAVPQVGKLDDICWVIFIKEHPNKSGRILTDGEALLLWKVFKRIDINECLMIDKEEVAAAFEHFVAAIGTPWTPVPMDSFSKELSWNFGDFLDCLEKDYMKSIPKSVYKEGLDALVSKYVTEVVKSGALTKKGHRVKSMKERWFVLFPNNLSYYTTKNVQEKKGDISINELTKVENITDTRTVKCRFAVVCGERQIKYEIDAPDQRTKNEWITAIQSCIDSVGGRSPLENQLLLRKEARDKRRAIAREEEEKRLEQEALIKQQLEQLEQLKLERERAEAQIVEEAAMLEEERKRRAELEEVKAEYERLLAEEKQAREAEEEVRLLQEKILDHEREKRLELEEIKALQDKILISERERREGLEEESKEQARLLEEERQRMKELQSAREQAEDALNDAHKKLEDAEEERKKAAEAVEAAKKRTRSMKMPAGLARPIQGGQTGIITHRGLGAFTEKDFSKLPQYMSAEERPVPVNATVIDDTERAVIEQPHLAKPSEKWPEQSQT